MASEPSVRTVWGSIAFTVPAVPTGMKAGVRMTPRGRTISPLRAPPSVAATLKEKPPVTMLAAGSHGPLVTRFAGEAQRARRSRGALPVEQAGVAVGIEAVALLDR